MALLNVENLRHYRNLGYNVLLEGEAGVGKTATISEAFAGVKWKYFSAATLDPWVDLVGVPRPRTDAKLGEVLDLIRPRFIVEDDVEAIFFDELNRAPPKVLNAVMELIQFKSINGHKLKNLKVIWAAINPDDSDGDYTVDKLDKALRDRFHVQIQVPYKLDTEYFNNKYPDIGPAFCAWWNDALNDQMKKQVSPRRLDYLADAYQNGCMLSDFVPDGINLKSLLASLKQGDFHAQLAEISTLSAAKTFLKDVNNSTKLLQLINKGDRVAVAFYKRFGSVMPKELVEALAPQIAAAERKVEMTSLGNLMAALKTTTSGNEMTSMLNGSAFAYPNGGSLVEEVRREIAQNSPIFKKLTKHMYEILSSGTKAELELVMFNDGPKKTDKSNVTKLAMLIASEDKLNDVWDKNQRKKISNHTYVMGCVGAKWM
jgi:hypothetical protein